MKEMKIERLPMNGAKKRGIEVNECHNLVRESATGRLMAADVPGVAKSDCAMPVTVIRHPQAGRIALCQSGNRLHAVYLDREGAPTADLGNLAGEARCGVVTDHDRAVVMTDRGPIHVAIDAEGGCRLCPTADSYPMLRFEAVSEMTLSQTIERCQLSGDYSSRSGALNKADTRRLTADMLEAYRRLSFTAAAGGYSLQPVVARYRLLGEKGETLYRSAPIAVMPQSGFQCMEGVEMTLTDGYGTRSATSLTATAFRLRLSTAGNYGSSGCGDVAQLVIETSGPIHPIDFGSMAATAIRSQGTNGATLTAFMPGTSVGMVKATALATDRLRGIAERREAAFSEAARIYRPFGDGSEIAVEFLPEGAARVSSDDQAAAVERLLTAKAEKTDYLLTRCGAPHSFTANRGVNLGNTVVWGDITPLRFKGYGIEQMALKVAGQMSWQGAIEVTMADGDERCASVGWGTSGAPLTLSPLLSYPSADAVSMTISLRRGDEIFRQSFRLTPTADGRSAIYVNPAGTPIELTERAESFSFPTGNEVRRRYANGAVSASASDPTEALSAVIPTSSAITAMAAVDRRGGAWEYARRRLYIFTTGGTILANLDAEGRWATMHRFDSRSVESQEAVTETTDDRYPVVCIAGSDLIGLSRGSMRVMRSGVRASKAGWDARRGQLWLADSNGSATIQEGVGGEYSTFGSFRAMRMLTCGDGLLLHDGRDLLDTLRQDTGTPSMAGYSLTLTLPTETGSLRGARLKAMALKMRGKMLIGTITLSDERNMMVCSARLTGDVGEEVALRLVSSPIKRLKISLHLQLTPLSQLEIEGARLIF